MTATNELLGDSFGGYDATGAASDVLRGGQGADNIVGDSYCGGGLDGAGTVIGDNGHDLIDLEPNDGSGRFSFAAGDNIVGSGAVAVGDGNDVIVGGSGRDAILGDNATGGEGAAFFNLAGGAGNDVLLGLGNDDALLGQGGKDRLDGGSGIDDLCAGGDGADPAVRCETLYSIP